MTTIKILLTPTLSVTALVDTGADRSCISSTIFTKLRDEKPLSLNESPISLNNANGTPITIQGYARFPLTLTRNVNVTTDILVCKNLTYPIIIGMDILLTTRAVIDLHDQSILFRSLHPSFPPERVYFAQCEVPQHYLTLSDDVEITPHSQNVISVRCKRFTSSETLLLQQNKAGTAHYPISVANAIIQPQNAETYATVNLLISNPTSSPVTLPSNTRVAILSPVSLNSVKQIGTLSISDGTSSFEWKSIDKKKPPPDIHLSGHAPVAFVKQTDSCDNSFSLTAANKQISKSLSDTDKQHLCELIVSNKDIFAVDPNSPLPMKSVPPVRINTGSHPPIKCSPYRRHPLAHRYIQEKTEEMEKTGLIRRSNSPWSFPVVLAAKSNGQIRFCIDYRRLNHITTPDAYTLPRLDDTLDALHGKRFFSTLDAAAGFHQIPLHPDSQPKTAFSTRSGLFQWTRLPFGWINAPAVFQRTTDHILRELTFTCALVYMDDIIVYSSTFKQHLNDLSEVFKRLREYSFHLKLTKCHFAEQSIEYLGHVVTGSGIKPKPALTSAISSFPNPTSQKLAVNSKAAVKRFVALANFYRRFIKGFARIAAPLVALTRKKAVFHWTPDHQRAFEKLKTLISSAPVLAYPNWNQPFILSTDASAVGIGAVLEQANTNGYRRPLQFLSYTFKGSECNWSMPEKELFALVFALRKFQVYLYGRPFHWYTDASSLQWLQSARNLAPKLLRWALVISNFNFHPHFTKGKCNAVADALSRHPTQPQAQEETISLLSLIHSPGIHNIQESPQPFQLPYILPPKTVSQAELKEAQRHDPFCRMLFRYLNPSVDLPRTHPSIRTNTTLCHLTYDTLLPTMSNKYIVIDDVLMFIVDVPNYYRTPQTLKRYSFLRPLIPFKLRTAMLRQFHIPSHRAAIPTFRSLAKHFYWPSAFKDVVNYVASCHKCSSRNVRPYLQGLLRSTPASSVTHRMSLDLIGPRPISKEGYRWILVMINHFTKWVVAVPLVNRTSNDIAQAFQQYWLSEGLACAEVYADRAPELWTNEFSDLCKRYNSSFIPGPPHHSQSQGFVERTNRTIQDGIAKNLEGSAEHWPQFLKPVIQAYRHTIHTATGHTPFFMMHGWEASHPSINAILHTSSVTSTTEHYVNMLRNNISTAWKQARIRLQQYHSRTQQRLNRNRSRFTLPIGSLVYVRIPPGKGQSQKFESFNTGLWKLTAYDERSNKCTVTTLADGHRRIEDVHAQYVFSFRGSPTFTLTPDFQSTPTRVTPPVTRQRKRSHHSSSQTNDRPLPALAPPPHAKRPKRRGRPRKTRAS